LSAAKQELKAGDRVGVAVSGGIDSVALLRLLLELRGELGIVLSVVHFNHKLRGTESDGDEEFVDGVTLIQAPGHTWGTCSLKVDLPNTGSMIFTSDAVYLKAAWGPPAVGSAGAFTLGADVQTNDPNPKTKVLHFAVSARVRPLVRVLVEGREDNAYLDFGDELMHGLGWPHRGEEVVVTAGYYEGGTDGRRDTTKDHAAARRSRGSRERARREELRTLRARTTNESTSPPRPDRITGRPPLPRSGRPPPGPEPSAQPRRGRFEPAPDDSSRL